MGLIDFQPVNKAPFRGLGLKERGTGIVHYFSGKLSSLICYSLSGTAKVTL
jgi:hypothetical protein